MSFSSLFTKKTSRLHLKLPILILAISFFISSCDKPDQTTASILQDPSTKEWVGKFFRDIMLDEGAIYTLWGSKPLSEIGIYYYSEEEVRVYYEQLSDEKRREGVGVENYDLPDNWEKWDKLRTSLPINKYLFVKKIHPMDEHITLVYFVNIANTTRVLKENYDLFKTETGLDFDPLSAVLEFEKGSEFWERAFSNTVLIGVLFGFGEKNSRCFYCKYNKNTEVCKQLNNTVTSRFSDKPAFGKVSLDAFPLPIFASFSEGEDEVIEKYQNERKKIQKIYQKQDFVGLTLKKLTSS